MTRIYGCYSVKIGGGIPKTYVVVMDNIFKYSNKIHECYDLKVCLSFYSLDTWDTNKRQYQGSWINRSASRGTKKGGQSPKVLKDMDMKRQLKMDSATKNAFIGQLQKDANVSIMIFFCVVTFYLYFLFLVVLDGPIDY